MITEPREGTVEEGENKLDLKGEGGKHYRFAPKKKESNIDFPEEDGNRKKKISKKPDTLVL